MHPYLTSRSQPDRALPAGPARAARSGAALTAQEAQVARIPPGRASPSATLSRPSPRRPNPGQLPCALAEAGAALPS